VCTRRQDTDHPPTRAWESVAGLLILTLWLWSAANGARRLPLEVRLEIQYEIPVRQPAQPRTALRREADVLLAGPDWAIMFPTGRRRDALLAVLRGALGQLDWRDSQDEWHEPLPGA
jgi:1-acyl-sn-glycerol-3-phosphate acyltransferase